MDHKKENHPAATTADRNKDPMTGAEGAHPVGVGVGAVAAGAAAGAAGGAIAGPIGAAAGAVIGAVAGGLAGKAAAEGINPTDPIVETKFWRDSHESRPYLISGYSYEEYAPAYRYGWERFDAESHRESAFEQVENELERGWDRAKGASRLTWLQAKGATEDAWARVKASVQGKGTHTAQDARDHAIKTASKHPVKH